MRKSAYRIKRKKRRLSKQKLLLIDGILLVIFIVAVVVLTVTVVGYLRDRAAYRAVQSLAVSTAVPTPVTPVETPAIAETASPTPLPTPPITVDFAAIREEARRVRGWLYSEGTVINYPVVYYTNHEYYLTHDYTGKRSNAGALFFDTRVSTEILGDQLIIYGHHMKDRSMFGSLLQYQKQDYYDAHPTMYLLLEDRHYRIDLISARFTDSEMENYPVWFESEEKKRAYIEYAKANSDFTPQDVAYDPNGRIISFVTCAYSNYVEDAKYQVMGWLVEIG